MSVKLWGPKIVSILCSMALLWQSFLSLPSYAADDGALIAKRNFMQAFQSQMAIANPTAEDFSSMLNAAKNVQKNLNDKERSAFEQKILTPLNAYQNATKVIDDCSCQDGDCSMKNLNLNFDLFTGDANSQCQRQKSILDDDFKNFLNSFNAVNVKLVTPDSFKRGGEGQSKQKNLKDFRDLLVAQTQEDLLLPYIKLSRNFRGPLPKNSKDLMSKLKVTAKKEQPLMSKVQEVLEEEIPESAENNVNTRREQLFTGLKKQLKDINTIYNEEADYDQAQIQIDRIAPSPWATNRSWIAPVANDSTLAVQREEIKQLFPAYDFDSKATTIDEVAAPIFQAQTFAAESTLSLPETTSIRILRQPKIIAPVPSRKINESVVPNYLKIKYGIVARGQKQFVGSEEDRALEEKKLTLDLKKYFMTFLLPQKSDLSHADKEKMADEFVRNLDENLDTSFREMQRSRKGASYSIMGGSALNFDDEHPYIKEQTKKAKTSQVQLGFSDTRSPNTRKFSASMMNNQDLNQEQIIGAGIRSAIQNVNTPSGTSLDSFLQKKVSANFKQRRQIADAIKGNPIFFNGKKGLGGMLYRGDPEAKKEDMQAALDDYFTKTEELLLDLEKNYDQDDPEDQIASILKRNPALIARVLSKNPQYASLVCDLKKKFVKDQKSSEVWDKIFFSAGMVLMGAAVILTAGAALGVFAVAGAVTATLGAAGFALGAVGTTRGAMSSAELFQEAREANEYLVALGVGNQEEVQKLLDNANRKMRDAFIEGGMTAIGGTGLGLTGKIFRYARGRNPAAVKVMLQEAAASKEGAKKMARTLEADTVSSTSVALNAKKYKTKEMLIKYEGEEKRLGQTFVSVKYLTDFERKAHQVYPKKGKFYDASGNLVCTGSPCKGIFVMDENGNLFFKQDPVEGEFHHSSFFGGHPVASAGEFEFIDGKLIMLKDKSGHYAPTTSDMKQVIDELDVKGIKLDKEQIDLSFSSNQAAKNQLSDQLEKNTDAREVRRKVDALIGVEPATLASMERVIERKVAAGKFESLVPQDKVIAIEKVLGRKLTDSEMEKLFTRSDWHESLSSGEYLKLSEKKIIKDEVLLSNETPIIGRNNDGASALEPKVAPAKSVVPEKIYPDEVLAKGRDDLQLMWAKEISDEARRDSIKFSRNNQLTDDEILKLETLNESRMLGGTIEGTHGGSGALAKTNWEDASHLVSNLVKNKSAYSVEDFKLINKTLNEGLETNGRVAGQLRSNDQLIWGKNHPDYVYLDGKYVKNEMDDFVKWMNETQKLVDGGKYPATEFAAKTYQRFVSIHPFFDGNGRTGRLLMDQVLLRNKLPPAVFNNYDESMVAVFGLKKVNPTADVDLLVAKIENAIVNAKKVLSGEKKIEPRSIPKNNPAAEAPTRRIEKKESPPMIFQEK